MPNRKEWEEAQKLTLPQTNVGDKPGVSIALTVGPDERQVLPIDTLDESLSEYERAAVYNNRLSSKRAAIYNAIDSERDYQDALGSDRTDGFPRSVGDYVTMLQYYQNQLVEEWTMNPGNEQALHVMRKIAGIVLVVWLMTKYIIHPHHKKLENADPFQKH